MRWCVSSCLLALGCLFAAAVSVGAQGTYTVRVAKERRDCARVEWKGDLKSDFVRFSPEFAQSFPDGFATFIEDLRITDRRGRVVPTTKDGATWRFPRAPKNPVRIRYSIRARHHDHPCDRDEVPFVRKNSVFWSGRALFLHDPAARNLRVRFIVPAGWNVSTPWAPVRGKRTTFAVADTDDLVASFLVLGRHHETIVEAGDTEVRIAVGGLTNTAAKAVTAAVRALVAQYRTICGGVARGRKLIAVHPYLKPSLGAQGGVYGRSASVLVGVPPSRRNAQYWIHVSAHELFHLWNGGAGLRPKGREFWFTEGFTDYYAMVGAARSGWADGDAVLAALERAHTEYRGALGSLTIFDSGRTMGTPKGLAYHGGRLVALSLDVMVRRATKNKQGLDAVMQFLFRRYGRKGERFDASAVVDRAARIGGQSVRTFFERHVRGTAPLPIEAVLRDAGLLVMKRPVRSTDFVVFKMFRIPSLTATPDGLEIERARDAGYRDGDLMVAVGGKPVRSIGDLVTRTARLDPGDRIAVTVLRKGKRITRTVELGGQGEPPPEKTALVFERNPKATPLQAAIRAAIFGPAFDP